MLSTRIVMGWNGFFELESSWKQLALEAAETPFQTFEWQHLWAQHYGRKTTPVFIEIREGNDLVGLMPLCIRQAAWKTLHSMGSGPSDYLPPLAHPSIRKIVAQSVASAVSSIPGVDLVDLQQLREVEPITQVDGADALLHQATCLVLDLPATYDDYLAQLGKSLRYDVRKLDKKLFSSGQARITTANESDADSSLNAFFELHSLRWKARGQFWGGAFLGKSHAFHHEWVRIAARNDWLRLSVLWVDEKPAGAIYGMAFGPTTFFYQSGFDPSQKAYSPGTLLVAHTIRQAIESGGKQFDFMRGDESYKRRWKPQREFRNLRRLTSVSSLGRVGLSWNLQAARVEEKIRAKLEGRDNPVAKEVSAPEAGRLSK